MIALRCCVTCLLAAALGCQTSEPASQAAPAPAAPAAAAPAVPAPKPAETPVATAPVKLESVPAREDFEEEAETQITPANLEKQLQALEKEISAD